MKIFSGSSNPEFAGNVAKQVGVGLSKCEIIRYTNSECKVTVMEDVIGEDCIVVQSTCNPTDEHIMELLFFVDALRRGEAKSITCVLPYFGYAKQNFQHRPGEAVSVEVVIKMLESIGTTRIVTYDIHDEGTKGVFTVPFDHLSAFGILAKSIKEEIGIDNLKHVVIVSPDQGGVERAREFSQILFPSELSEIAVVEKHRDPNKMNEIVPVGFYGNVKDKIAVIVDDMIVSGGTMRPAVELCRSHGAKKVYIAVTHPDFSIDAPKKLQDLQVDKIIISNTIPLRSEQKFVGLQIDDVSHETAKLLRSLYE